jgi:predicted negative regulator of RcsB-dependent stress response
MSESKEPKDILHPDRDLEQKEVHEVLVFLQKNGLWIALGIAVVILGLVGGAAMRKAGAAKAAEAGRRLATARSIAEIEAVAEEFPDTPSGATALLRVARQEYQAGRYDAARERYRQFRQQVPDHPLAAATALGEAMCLEGAARYEEAVASCLAFLEAQPDSAFAPLAQFCRARSLEQLGRAEEARAVYEDYIAAHPDGAWIDQAELALRYLDRTRRVAPPADDEA